MKFLTNTSLKAVTVTAATLMIIAAPSAQAGACDTICSGFAEGVRQWQLYQGMEAAKKLCNLLAEAAVADAFAHGAGAQQAGIVYGNRYSTCINQQQQYTQTLADAAAKQTYNGCMGSYLCS